MFNQVCHIARLGMLSLCLLLIVHDHVCGQKADSTKVSKKKNNILQAAINAVSRSVPNDSTVLVNTPAETPFLPFEGKVIRRVIIKEFGFDKIFEDTSHRIKYFGTRLLNSLHKKTRNWVIKENMFIHEGNTLNAYKVADNERYLRTLNFIQDARILVNYIPGNNDSVDIVVITKDLFSLTAELSDLSADRFKGRIGDANVLGMGQSVRFTTLVDQKRTPHFGYELLYTKSNIGNSFINASLAYTTINSNIGDGREDEQGWIARLDRPLYSQYAHIAGALTIGRTQSTNAYNLPDSEYYNYKYNLYDGWIGYNLDVKKLLANKERRKRAFISARYFRNYFTQAPYQVAKDYNLKFDNKQAALGQITFFKQDFYKTNYLYGFGTTEDIPYGYNVSLTSGWYEQKTLGRLYIGVDANRYFVSKRGSILQYFLRAGSFFHENGFQDANILAGATYFSRLILYNNLKIRQYVRFSAARQFNRTTFDPLRIDNTFGVRYMSTDSIVGDRRISLHSETYFFLKYKIFGFQFAPFTFGDVCMLTPEQKPINKSDFYYSLGGGLRTRNNNFVFGTIELRFAYFPRRGDTNNGFKVMLQSDLNFRYNNNYIKAPSIIQVNDDDNNSIY